MPFYTTHDPKGWCGDPSRGAALGRPTVHRGEPVGACTLRKVRLDAGGYDVNGTYFGGGPPDVYWYADEGGNVDGTFRARSRQDALDKLRALFPDWPEAQRKR